MTFRFASVLALLISALFFGPTANAQESSQPSAPIAVAPSDEVTQAPSEVAQQGDGTTAAPPSDPAQTTTSPQDTGNTTLNDTAPGPIALTSPAAPTPPAPTPSAPLPWRSSLFSFQHASTVNTFVKDGQLSYNPVYYWSFFLQGRWYLDSKNFLVLSQGLSIEWTDSDFTTSRREPELGDTTLEFRHAENIAGFGVVLSGRLGLPLSKASQAAQRYLNTGLSVNISRAIPEAAGLTFALSLGYRRWWAGSNVSLTQTKYYGGNGLFGSEPTNQAAGGSTERDRLTGGVTVNVTPFENFTLSTSFFVAAINGHDLAPHVIKTTGEVLHDSSPSHWRNFTYWSLQAGYDFNPWLNVSIGYQSSGVFTPWLNDNGSVRNPFANPDSEVFMSATVMLDGLYESVRGSSDESGTPEERQRRRQGLASNGSRLTQ